MDTAQELQRIGQLVPTHALLRAGATSHQLTVAVRRGEIIRVRQGWYTLPDVHSELARAARVGGRLACVSAARQHGLAARGTPLHVEVAQNGARLRDPANYRHRLRGGVRVHWRRNRGDGDEFCLSVRAALRQMATCATPELTVAAVDSALRLKVLTPEQWHREVERLPRRLRRLLLRVDARAESITESVVRFRLAMLGIDAQPQVQIRGVGRVDLLIGEALVIEVDGWEYHSDRDQFELDRRRDARLSALGYRVLRFSYRQVFERWSEVRAAILAAIARGDTRC